MNIKRFNQYFGGRYMKYWYVAFVIVMSWFVVNLFNNGSVHTYVLTAYSNDGKPLNSMVVDQVNMVQPEALPVAKAYKPVKPIKFLP